MKRWPAQLWILQPLNRSMKHLREISMLLHYNTAITHEIWIVADLKHLYQCEVAMSMMVSFVAKGTVTAKHLFCASTDWTSTSISFSLNLRIWQSWRLQARLPESSISGVYPQIFAEFLKVQNDDAPPAAPNQLVKFKYRCQRSCALRLCRFIWCGVKFRHDGGWTVRQRIRW